MIDTNAMTLTEAQEIAAKMLRDAEASAGVQRAYLRQLRDDLRVLEEVLPVKRAAVARAEADYEGAQAILSESFSLYRDLMDLRDV